MGFWVFSTWSDLRVRIWGLWGQGIGDLDSGLTIKIKLFQFMEVKVSQGENGTYDMDPTETRVNPTFVFWYTVIFYY